MEGKTFKTHMIYVDYPMNSLNLKEMEDNINSLEVNLGDIVIVDCLPQSQQSRILGIPCPAILNSTAGSILD